MHGLLGLRLCRSGLRKWSCCVLSVKSNTNVYLRCTFLCARQFHLAVLETAYVKFRAEFISVTPLWEPGHFWMSLCVPCLLPGSTLGNDNVLKPALLFDTSDTLNAPHRQWVLSAPERQTDMVLLSHVPGVCLCLLSGCSIPVTPPWDADPAGHYLHKAVASLLQPQWVLMLSLISLAYIHLGGAEFWMPTITVLLPYSRLYLLLGPITGSLLQEAFAGLSQPKGPLLSPCVLPVFECCQSGTTHGHCLVLHCVGYY